ncbi:MAG: hypothetical protein CVU11_05455 [Bacteroidetes bacterium HGW-Bacteroidetes-6]|jgi:uncharacterized protein with PQ loop repeat|nr:MAG: hypothetical protein CVU11_05455 [Bacteroidetes bacterium HGW-Bacteroidetes-6]
MSSFSEIQSANKPINIIGVIVLWLSFLVWGIYSLYQNIYNNQPLSDDNMPMSIFIGMIVFLNLTFAFMLFMVLRLTLTVSIGESGIIFKMPPFKKSTQLKKDDIVIAYVKKYRNQKNKRLLGGYRRVYQIKSFSIRGHWGIHIVLKNGKQYLLGISDHKQAAKTLENLGFNKQPTK